MAEPYINRPGVHCEREPEPRIGHREQVSCDLGDRYLGFFQSMVTPAGVRAVRDGDLRAEGGQALAGTVRSLRWKPAAGRRGVKIGIPADGRDRGDGVRVRFLDPDGGKWLHFDVDGGHQYALLATLDPGRTPEDLRRFWADPDR